MVRSHRFGWLMLCALCAGFVTLCLGVVHSNAADRPRSAGSSTSNGASTPPVEMFDALDRGLIEVRFIPRNSREATVTLTNKSDQPLSVKLPETFVGVPILAQMQGQNNPFANFQLGGNQQQNSRSAPQGLGSGKQANRGDQNFFNIPPEKFVRVRVDCVCLDYGHPEPSPRMPYQIQKTESYVDRPAVAKLLKNLGSAGVDQQVVQAAAWHLNNDLTWQKLASQWSAEVRLIGPSPTMFSKGQLKAARTMADEARRAAGAPVEPAPPRSSLAPG